MTRLLFRATALGLVCCTAAFAGPPVGWRNDGSGYFPDVKPPQEWGSDKNVVWKVALPGPSYAAPIVVGENLLVVSEPAELLCVRRSDGKVMWKQSLSDIKAPAAGRGGRGGRGGPGGGGGGRGGRGGRGGPGGGGGGGRGGSMGGGLDRSAGMTAATPVSDGKYVAVVAGNGVVTVSTLDGKRVWGKYIESPQQMFGHAASPVLLGDKLIVHIKDMTALDLATGKEVWRVKLPAAHASPVAARLGKEDIIISPAAGAIVRASDGKVLSKGKFSCRQGSPVVSGDTICVSGKDEMQAVKMKMSDSGEVTVSSLWSKDGSNERHHLPSALVHDGLMYDVTNSGYLNVIEVSTGKRLYRERLNLRTVYSSVTLAGGLIYVFDLDGKSVVFKPGRTFQRVAVNQLEGTGACPAFAGEYLYLRGKKNLYCIAAGKQTKPATASEKSGK
jgi:outer membrane protein assembly factor BamB